MNAVKALNHDEQADGGPFTPGTRNRSGTPPATEAQLKVQIPSLVRENQKLLHFARTVEYSEPPVGRGRAEYSGKEARGHGRNAQCRNR